jgi:3D (Asp-Asp-Asp) domain-containing protein
MNKLFPLLLLTPIASGSTGINSPPKFPPPIQKEVSHIVTLTTYSTCIEQTDSTPYITASGFKLDSINPKRHKVIAISRDLKSKFRFRDRVRIVDAGRYSGVYRVEDVMNKRFRNRVDVLVNPKDKGTRLSNVKIVKL